MDSELIYCSATRTMDFDNYYASEIPMPKISWHKQKPIIGLVDHIFSITTASDYLDNASKQDKVKAYDCQIDKMVYKLYGLDKEEIQIIEGLNITRNYGK